MAFDAKLENFDDVWGLGEPAIIEKEFRTLLLQAKALNDKSIYLQLLSQIALTQALQKQFDGAHKTLDQAEKLLTPDKDLARVRILLERGRVFQQSDKVSKARLYFERSFKLSAKHNFDYHTINAAHMIAIVAKKTEDKVKWNQRALKLAQKTGSQRAHSWLGPLYNNLGQNYLEAKQFQKALAAFKKALMFRKKEGYLPNILVAQWAVACALRSLGHLDKALIIQNNLLKEYEALAQSGSFNIPVEMFALVRGLVYEELAEIYDAKAKIFSNLAYNDLSQDLMFRKTAPKRLERLKQIQQ